MEKCIESYCVYDHVDDVFSKAMVFKEQNQDQSEPRTFSLFMVENGKLIIKEGVCMERFQHMTCDEAEEFITQVSNLGQIMEFQKDQQSENQNSIEKLKTYLRANFVPYLIYYISDGTNHLSEAAVQKVLSGEKWTNAIRRVNTYLNAGDAEGVICYCRALRAYYRAMKHGCEEE